jgi:hypothetical protein
MIPPQQFRNFGVETAHPRASNKVKSQIREPFFPQASQSLAFTYVRSSSAPSKRECTVSHNKTTPKKSNRGSPRRGSSGIRVAVMEETVTDTEDEYDDGTSRQTSTTVGTGAALIKRYRGFSTSISSLFLDEAVVCGSMGCFGMILSARTEYLLQLRNERRGALSPKSFSRTARKMPSRIISLVLLMTVLLVFSTFLIWGFGGPKSSNAGNNFASYSNYNNENNSNNNYNNNYDNGNNNNAYNNDDGGKDDDNNNGEEQQQQQQQQQQNDDGNNNGGDDDRANNGGDDNNDGANDGEEEEESDDERQRKLQKGPRRPDHPSTTRISGIQPQPLLLHRHHPTVGIFKLRDYHEGLWRPLREAIHAEWTRTDYYDQQQTTPPPTHPRRSVEDSSGSSSSSNAADTVEDTEAFYHRYFSFQSDLATTIRLSLGVAFLMFLGILGRRRRMRTRFHLVRARAQEDHLYYASSDAAAARRVAFDDTREDQYEGACSHTLCGCYPSDEVDPIDETDDNVEVTDSGVYKRKRKPHHEDIAARSFNCLMSTCCGFLCKCWCHCLSICALAQEAREVRLLIPPRYQRIDYITHQPFHEYQMAVNDLRRGWLGKARRLSGITPHWAALSRLSRYILVTFILVIAAITAALVFNPRVQFNWADGLVLIATFVQAFLVLFIVHGIFHKSDLSLDAVIKFFTSGFLIATPTAFVFEGMLINTGWFASYLLYDFFYLIFEDAFKDWLSAHIRIYWLISELLNAYIVAAVTEELCKYYAFRAIEHPDLVFLTGLQREDADNTNMVEGGIVKYPFGSLQVQELARNNSFADDASRMSGQSSKGSHRSSQYRSSRSKALIERTGTMDKEFEEDENDVRTRRQRAMAITTGMIGVAVGLACAENFLYVFVLGGSATEFEGEDEDEEAVLQAWVLLLFRSVFPVHALAAAMQSINMIRKFVELDSDKGHRVGVGRIVLPAVLLHGTFDAILMGVNVYVEMAWEKYLKENNGIVNEEDGPPYNALLVNIVTWASVIGLMILSFLWYYRENRSQRARLILLEAQDKAQQAEEYNPAVASEKA